MDRPANRNLSRGQFWELHQRLDVDSPDEGGFTRHMTTGDEPSSGVAVSDLGPEEHYGPNAAQPYEARHLPGFVKRNLASLSEPEVYFGGWKPKDQPREVYLDVSRRYPTSTAAIRAMRRRNQIAGFDLGTGATYYNPHHPENEQRLWDALQKHGRLEGS